MTVTEDDFRLAWSDAYWEARDFGISSAAATAAADTATEHLLDQLEDA